MSLNFYPNLNNFSNGVYIPTINPFIFHPSLPAKFFNNSTSNNFNNNCDIKPTSTIQQVKVVKQNNISPNMIGVL